MSVVPNNMTFKNLLLIFTVSLLLIICAACGTSNQPASTQASQTPSSVKITPANVMLQQWAAQEFTAHAYDQNGNEITNLNPAIYIFNWTMGSYLTSTENTSQGRTLATLATNAGTGPISLTLYQAANGNNSAGNLATVTTNVTITSDPIAVVSLSGSSSNSLNWIISPQVVDASNGIVPLTDIGVTTLQWFCTYNGVQPPACNPAWVDNGNQIPTGQVTIPKTSEGLGISIYAEYDGGSGGNVVSKTLVCNYATNQCQ
jgi:hypothetical protein